MPTSIALRIDGALTAVLAWIASEAINGWGVREVAHGPDGDNEHWHFHLWGDRSIKALRCTFNRKVTELKGNGAYSMTVVKDADKYDRYMAKGEGDNALPEVVYSSSLTYNDDMIKQLHTDYWNQHKKLKRKREGSMIDWVIDEAKNQRVQWSDRAKLAEIYIREVGERGKPINLHAVRSNLNAVQFALCPDDGLLKILVERVEQY